MSTHPLPTNIKSIAEIIKGNPQIKKFGKFFNTKDFVPLGFVVVSQPQSHPSHTIYGLFLINKKGVLMNMNPGTQKPQPELKQDYIAIDRTSNKVTYYSGGSKAGTGNHQSMKSFCKTYGKFPDGSWGQYGCSKNLKTNQHWYRNESYPTLPGESWITSLIKAELTKFRNKYLPAPATSAKSAQ